MCDFKVPHAGNTEAMLSKLKHVVAKNNGTLTETETGGSFTMNTMLGSIGADYTLLPDAVEMHITEKPFFMACSALEGFVTDFLTKVK